MRQVESMGGFASLLRRGDPDRGALVLIVTMRGKPHAMVERQLTAAFDYRWTVTATAHALIDDKFRESMEKRLKVDPDFWLIELDVPDAERFIAETTALS